MRARSPLVPKVVLAALGAAAFGAALGAVPLERARASSLARAPIQAEVRRSRQAIRRCYEQYLARVPQARGTVTLEVVIGADGRVARASVARTDVGDRVMLDCVLAVARRWRFPPPGTGEVTIRYPFRLRTFDRSLHWRSLLRWR